MSIHIYPGHPDVYNGVCEDCNAVIYGDSFVIKSGPYITKELHVECAVTRGIICGDCLKDECSCEELAEKAEAA